MIIGRWGKPSEVLLDIVVEPNGDVRGIVNPGRRDAPIRRGHFDAVTGAVHLEGSHVGSDGATTAFQIDGRLFVRTLCLTYHYGAFADDVPILSEEMVKCMSAWAWYTGALTGLLGSTLLLKASLAAAAAATAPAWASLAVAGSVIVAVGAGIEVVAGANAIHECTPH